MVTTWLLSRRTNRPTTCAVSRKRTAIPSPTGETSAWNLSPTRAKIRKDSRPHIHKVSWATLIKLIIIISCFSSKRVWWRSDNKLERRHKKWRIQVEVSRMATKVQRQNAFTVRLASIDVVGNEKQRYPNGIWFCSAPVGKEECSL